LSRLAARVGGRAADRSSVRGVSNHETSVRSGFHHRTSVERPRRRVAACAGRLPAWACDSPRARLRVRAEELADVGNARRDGRPATLRCGLHLGDSAELVWREPAPDLAWTSRWRNSARTAVADHARPRVGPSITQNSGPGGSAARFAIQPVKTDHAQRIHPHLARRRSPCRAGSADHLGARSGRSR
jgi:hypothetical protein